MCPEPLGCRDHELAGEGGLRSLDLKAEVRAGGRGARHGSDYLFKAMALEEVTSQMSTGKEEQSEELVGAIEHSEGKNMSKSPWAPRGSLEGNAEILFGGSPHMTFRKVFVQLQSAEN